MREKLSKSDGFRSSVIPLAIETTTSKASQANITIPNNPATVSCLARYTISSISSSDLPPYFYTKNVEE